MKQKFSSRINQIFIAGQCRSNAYTEYDTDPYARMPMPIKGKNAMPD